MGPGVTMYRHTKKRSIQGNATPNDPSRLLIHITGPEIVITGRRVCKHIDRSSALCRYPGFALEHGNIGFGTTCIRTLTGPNPDFRPNTATSNPKKGTSSPISRCSRLFTDAFAEDLEGTKGRCAAFHVVMSQGSCHEANLFLISQSNLKAGSYIVSIRSPVRPHEIYGYLGSKQSKAFK